MGEICPPFPQAGRASQLPLPFSWLVGSFSQWCCAGCYIQVSVLDFGILVPVFACNRMVGYNQVPGPGGRGSGKKILWNNAVIRCREILVWRSDI